MIALILGVFFSGVAVTLFAVACFMRPADRRGGLLSHDSPGARRAIGARPW